MFSKNKDPAVASIAVRSKQPEGRALLFRYHSREKIYLIFKEFINNYLYNTKVI
jgi:hypothetical protein